MDQELAVLQELGERELAADLAHLRELLEHGDVEEARALTAELEVRWPDSVHVRHFAHVLAPPTASVRPDVQTRPLDRERAWLHQHARDYPGRWLAILEDRLIAADRDLRAVLAVLRETPDANRALLHFQPGSTD